MKATHRVRFAVPYTQALHDRTFILSRGLNARVWMEVMLTYLCCPKQNHPAVAFIGDTSAELVTSSQVASRDVELGESRWDYRWEATLIPLMDPGLALADSTLLELLALTWHWVHEPGGVILLPGACRLAAFASHFARQPVSWGDLHARWTGGPHATPHELIELPDYHVALLPWIREWKGF